MNAFGKANENALEILRSKDVKVQSNRIGLGRFGSVPFDVFGFGILVDGGENHTIGTPDFTGLINARVGLMMKNVVPSSPGLIGAIVQNLNFNLDETGIAKLSDSMETGACIENCAAVRLGGTLENVMNAFGKANENALEILRSEDVQVQANHIGTTRGGSAPMPVSGTGVLIDGGSEITVGAAGIATVINAQSGLVAKGVTGTAGKVGVKVENVNFNLNAVGDAALGATMQTAICLEDCSGAQIGGATSETANAIGDVGGNAIEAIRSTEVEVTGNRIGVGRIATSAFSIAGDSVMVDGSSSGVTVVGNAIENATGAGVNVVDADAKAVVRRNRIVKCGTAIQRASFDASSAITAAARGSTHVEGVLTGVPGESLTVDFYAYDPTATSAELDLFIGTTTLVLDGSGQRNYSELFTPTAPLGWRITNTVTSDRQGTSEAAGALVITPPVDTDGDGFPDAYEALYPECFNPLVADDPDADCDGDGLTDREEYLLGSNPHSSAEFAVKPTGFTEDGMAVEIQVAPGRRYRLERLTLQGEGTTWMEVASQYFATSGQAILVDPNPPSDRALYRVVAGIE